MILVNRVLKSSVVKSERPQEVRFQSDQKFLCDHGLTEADVHAEDCGSINGAWVSQFHVRPEAMHKVKSPPSRELQPPEPKGRKDDAEKPRYDLPDLRRSSPREREVQRLRRLRVGEPRRPMKDHT